MEFWDLIERKLSEIRDWAGQLHRLTKLDFVLAFDQDSRVTSRAVRGVSSVFDNEVLGLKGLSSYVWPAHEGTRGLMELVQRN